MIAARSKSLEEFVRDDDRIVFGVDPSSSISVTMHSSLQNLRDLVDIHVINSFKSVPDLYTHLDSLNLLDPENLRPGWDAYFMVCFSVTWIDSISCMFTDISGSCISAIELYETSCWSRPRTGQPCPVYRVRNLSSYQTKVYFDYM